VLSQGILMSKFFILTIQNLWSGFKFLKVSQTFRWQGQNLVPMKKSCHMEYSCEISVESRRMILLKV
jgi:hypothetical protein